VRIDAGVGGVERHLDDDAVHVGVVVQPVDLTDQLNLGRAPDGKQWHIYSGANPGLMNLKLQHQRFTQ
jgi:hypothetical protein